MLHTLPFDADRKRMSVVVRDSENRVILLTKGADASVLPVLSKDFTMSEQGEETLFKAQTHLSDYAKDGLRTLCLCRKEWKEEDYQAINRNNRSVNRITEFRPGGHSKRKPNLIHIIVRICWLSAP